MSAQHGRTRVVDAPDRDYLTAVEVAEYFRFGRDTLEKLIAEGRFPQAQLSSDGVKVWSWRDVLFWVLTMEVRHRLLTKPTPPTVRAGNASGIRGKSSETGGEAPVDA